MDIGSIESGKVTIKVLTTNNVSVTLRTDEKFNGKVIQPGVSSNKVSGEHGISIIIKIIDGDETRLFLMDTGGLVHTIFENSKQFSINLNEVDKLILSHGHYDHFGGMSTVIPLLKKNSEIYLNPDCYLQTYGAITKTGEEIPPEDIPEVIRKQKEKLAINRKMPALNRNLISNMANQTGVNVIETKEPVKLHEGIVTSGEIELFDEDELTKGIYIMKSRKEFEKNYFRDETTIYINIEDKGLVVITGCGDCG